MGQWRGESGLCGLCGNWESVGVVMLREGREFPLCEGRWRERSVGQWRGGVESVVCVREGKRVGSQWVL